MRWITGITIDNYRAFKDSYASILIPAKQHLLIYGENGSGKSSLYNSVKDFFNSSADETKSFDVNYFSQLAGNDAGTIKLKIADLNSSGEISTENEYTFGKPDIQSNHRIPAITVPNKVKGFLDYKNVLDTYFRKSPPGQNPNIFELVVEDLLTDHLINRTGGGVATYPLGEEWKRIYEPIYKYDRRYRSHRDSIAELPSFEAVLRELLIQVFTVFKRLIFNYFDPKLDIGVTLSNMTFDYHNWELKEELKLEIKYAGELINSYDTFLNEARLSAIGISIYLAALKTYPPAASDLKVLFLDDVFIGLDTSNRFPLLDIIKKEFIDDGFQVFISTYDREWFELSRHWFQTKLPGKIKSLELFIEDDGNPATPDYPVVIPYDGYLAKAKAYFKSKDYPSAGNYLRKECEWLIKKYLPVTFKVDETGKPIDELESLMKKLEEYFIESGVPKPQELINAVRIYRKALLNPTSHSDIKSALFKKEIDDAFAIVDKLSSLPPLERKLVFNKGEIFRYENLGGRYSIQLELADNIYLSIYEGRKAFSKHRFSIKTWTRAGIEFATDDAGNIMLQQQIDNIRDQIRPLSEIFDGINRSTGIAVPVNLYAELKIGATGTLNDLLI